MLEANLKLPMDASSKIDSYKQKIAYANELCRVAGSDALARLCVSAIRSERINHWKKQNPNDETDDELLSQTPIPSRAYVLRQFKRPEELQLLRKVYGSQFIAISIFDSEEQRIKNIESAERKSLGGLCNEAEVHAKAFELVSQDSKERGDIPGQNVRDAFPLGDVFIDGRAKSSSKDTIQRFIHLLFGNNQITPTRDEYGMYLAKSASLRSSDLSRQVGAAIFSKSGEVATLGCNEVPKAGGGTYWSDDIEDHRDFQEGLDPNEEQKTEILVDFVDRLLKSKKLSPELLEINDSVRVSSELLKDKSSNSVGESRLMDLIEFGRIIHAEMSAISDAARKGVAIQNGTLFCTTFPCHICAKHIVAVGLKRVVYLEPYPKSYATKLHQDSIEIGASATNGKVHFESFIGVSPFRYRNLFEKGKRKYMGKAEEWNRGKKRPQIDVYFPSYFKAEALVVKQLKHDLISKAKS